MAPKDEGTDLEKVAEEKEVQDTIFNDAFNVAAGAEETPAEKPEETEEKAPAEKMETVEKTETKPEKPEDFEQKWRSLDGIIKSQRTKYETEKAELVTELESLKQTVASLSGKNKDTAQSPKMDDLDLTSEDKKALEEYEKDFDIVSKMEGKKRELGLKKLEKRLEGIFEDKLKNLTEQFSSQINPIASNLQEAEKIRHFSTIGSSHPDFEKYRDDGSILSWIETKPQYMQEAMRKTYKEGAAGDVVDLITDFKQENNLLENKNNQPPSNVVNIQKAEKKKALTAVVGKHGAVQTNRISADDYDSAFEEATGK